MLMSIISVTASSTNTKQKIAYVNIKSLLDPIYIETWELEKIEIK